MPPLSVTHLEQVCIQQVVELVEQALLFLPFCSAWPAHVLHAGRQVAVGACGQEGKVHKTYKAEPPAQIPANQTVDAHPKNAQSSRRLIMHATTILRLLDFVVLGLQDCCSCLLIMATQQRPRRCLTRLPEDAVFSNMLLLHSHLLRAHPRHLAH